MKKLFTKELVQALGVIVLAAVIGFGISIASADWTAPLAAAPTCATGNPGCDAPINTSSLMQTKGTGAMVANFIDTSLSRAITNLGGMSSIGNADFQGGIFNFGTKGVSNAQGQGNYGVESDFYAPVSLYSDAFADPLTIDLSANTTGSQSTDAIMLKGSSSSSVNHINIITDKPLLNFFDDNAADHSVNQNTGDTSIGAHNGYFSGNLQIKGDNNAAPSNGQVLTSTDASGDSTWGTLAASGGGMNIQYVSTMENLNTSNTNGNHYGMYAMCPSGYQVIGGGGDCSDGPLDESLPVLAHKLSNDDNGGNSSDDYGGYSENPPSNVLGSSQSTSYRNQEEINQKDSDGNNTTSNPALGWFVHCTNESNNDTEDVHAYAICAQIAPTTISVAPNTAVVVNPNANVPGPSAATLALNGTGTLHDAPSVDYCFWSTYSQSFTIHVTGGAAPFSYTMHATPAATSSTTTGTFQQKATSFTESVYYTVTDANGNAVNTNTITATIPVGVQALGHPTPGGGHQSCG